MPGRIRQTRSVAWARAKKNGGRISGPRPFQNDVPGLLGSAFGRSSSGISSRSGSGVGGSSVNSSVNSSASGVDSSGTGITGGVHGLSCAIHCGVGSLGGHFSSFGCLLGSFGRLFGGLAAAAGDHQQCNWQTQPSLAKSSAHVVILLYPQQLTARLRQRTLCLISASWLRDTPRTCLFAETGSHPIAAIRPAT